MNKEQTEKRSFWSRAGDYATYIGAGIGSFVTGMYIPHILTFHYYKGGIVKSLEQEVIQLADDIKKYSEELQNVDDANFRENKPLQDYIKILSDDDHPLSKRNHAEIQKSMLLEELETTKNARFLTPEHISFTSRLPKSAKNFASVSGIALGVGLLLGVEALLHNRNQRSYTQRLNNEKESQLQPTTFRS